MERFAWILRIAPDLVKTHSKTRVGLVQIKPTPWVAFIDISLSSRKHSPERNLP
jgi:hypothetical protein